MLTDSVAPGLPLRYPRQQPIPPVAVSQVHALAPLSVLRKASDPQTQANTLDLRFAAQCPELPNTLHDTHTPSLSITSAVHVGKECYLWGNPLNQSKFRLRNKYHYPHRQRLQQNRKLKLPLHRRRERAASCSPHDTPGVQYSR